ncbi:hypothetical protein SAMN04515674_105283 [Pseudarcicella hirudinis]|uniref:Lipocalin-like domain-containing protein n=1 Tax=Pseudarcicella hirudinis TaxID=1079859 RepID=A0A1I5SYP0_9BACT|nr:hypothetical protein [Pseudarcicella hirudinis]SFP75924.1 hypothetical protein SAMN04515674_105283 [Pseudarcicella hirudinis]
MSPPSWIVGTWYFTPNIPSQGFIVQSDNVIVLTGSSQVDLKDNASKSSGTMIIKELSKSSTVYEIQVLLNGSEYLYYKFTNTSNPTVSSVVMRSMAVSQSVTVSLYKKI